MFGRICRLPRKGHAHTSLVFRVVVVGDEGRLGAHLPDNGYGMYGRNEFEVVTLFIGRDGIDFLRTTLTEFIGAGVAVSIVVAGPHHIGDLLNLDDDIGITQPRNFDLLSQLHGDET